MEPPGTEIRREREIADQLLATRSAQALTAARIEPPAYIVKELGERPANPVRAKAWDRGVESVESYRLKYGVRNTGHAFDREPQSGAEQRGRLHSEALPRLSAGSALSS
jgi:hypothetical protein